MDRNKSCPTCGTTVVVVTPELGDSFLVPVGDEDLMRRIRRQENFIRKIKRVVGELEADDAGDAI